MANTQTGLYPVCYLSREDIKQALQPDRDTQVTHIDNITDEQMKEITGYMGEFITEMNYWQALEKALEITVF